MGRPSNKELFNKIKSAKQAVLNESVAILDPAVIADDAINLGYQLIKLNEILLKILEEIEIGHYAGSHPPQKSYKSEIQGAELFAFRWLSKIFGCTVYFKFAFKNNLMYLVSLHQHQEGKGEQNDHQHNELPK